jgi:hypothetical protein
MPCSDSSSQVPGNYSACPTQPVHHKEENPMLDEEELMQCNFYPFGINPEEEKVYTTRQLAQSQVEPHHQ